VNNEARQKLREIVDTYGQSVVNDPRRCKALLLDLCGQHRREILVLSAAQEERVANDLRDIKGGIPLPVLVAQLTRRLVDNRALAEEAARWAVEAWAYALHLTDDDPPPTVDSPSELDKPPPLPVTPPPLPDMPSHPVEDQGYRPTSRSAAASTSRAQQTFASARTIEVYGRSRRGANAKWQKLGSTPGSVALPPNYVLGLRFFHYQLQELGTWIKEILHPDDVVSLDLNGPIDDTGMAALRAFPNLTYLEVDTAERVTNAGLAFLVGLQKLTTLHFPWATGVTDEGMAYLRALPELAGLLLHWAGISDAALRYLEALTKLSVLELRECKHITGSGLLHLRAAPHLTTLDLAGASQFNDTGAQAIGLCVGLNKLDLSRCPQITRQGIVHLRNLINLTYLDLSKNPQVDDRGVVALCELQRLSTLNLAGTAITNIGLSHIGDIPGLLYLDLSQCERINDRGLSHLRRLKKLAYLNVSGCKQLTPRGIARLARPNLFIMQ
jgi:ABC-type transporter Mla MlaB component